MRFSTPVPCSAGLCIALALVPAVARAGNDDGVPFGNQAVMTAGALTANVDDGSATWFNPAGLAFVTRDSVDVSASIYRLRIGATPGLLSSADGASTGGDYVDFAVVPSAMTMVRRLGGGFVLGIGIFAPELTNHEEKLSLRERIPSEGLEADWRLNTSEGAERYLGGLALGWTILPGLRFGVSLFGRYDQGSVSTDFTGTIRDADGAVQGVVAEIFHIAETSLGLGLGAGVQWEPFRELALGLSLQTPYVSLGAMYEETGASISATADGIESEPDETMGLDVRFVPYVPMRVRFGVALRLRPIVVSFDGDIQHELSSPDLGVNRRTIGGLRVGVRGTIDDTVSLGGGLFTDFSPDRQADDYGRSRVDYVGATFGMELRSEVRLGDGQGAASIVFLQTFGARYAYGQGTTGGLRFDLLGAEPLALRQVRTTVHEVGVHMGSGMYF